MQSRPAAERPSRLSLLPLVRDFDEAAAGQPAAASPAGPKSEMEWDEEEAPRAQEKVRDLFLRVSSPRERHRAAAVVAKAPAKAKAKAMQRSEDGETSASGHGLLVEPSGITKRGSVQNARRGIEERRKLEVSHPTRRCTTLLTDILPALKLASVR
jgi:hypothetical protein